MRRILLLALPLTLIVAACTGTTLEETFESQGDELPPATIQRGTSLPDLPPPSGDESAGGTDTTQEPEATPEGPPAPDFTLALEPSGEFILSQEVKPVFMVFWAEW